MINEQPTSQYITSTHLKPQRTYPPATNRIHNHMSGNKQNNHSIENLVLKPLSIKKLIEKDKCEA